MDKILDTIQENFDKETGNNSAYKDYAKFRCHK